MLSMDLGLGPSMAAEGVRRRLNLMQKMKHEQHIQHIKKMLDTLASLPTHQIPQVATHLAAMGITPPTPERINAIIGSGARPVGRPPGPMTAANPQPAGAILPQIPVPSPNSLGDTAQQLGLSGGPGQGNPYLQFGGA